MKQYLVFVNYNYTPYVFVRWDRKHKPILNPPTMFYTDTRPPKYYKSFNRAEITQRKLQISIIVMMKLQIRNILNKKL